MKKLIFSWIDYSLFSIMLGLSIAIGLYFGFCGKQNTTQDYLHGGKQMKVLPVAMSLVASTISGIAMVGVPSEIYVFGTQYWMMLISILITVVFVNKIYLPVFYKLQLISVFEYLEIRFDKSIRTMSSILFTVANLMGIPVTIYAPALAFSYVTGYTVHMVSLVIAVTCIIYTTIGGVKAVIWTDSLQFCVTLCTLCCVLIMGTISVGGVSKIWADAELGNRLDFFNMDLDLTVRNSFWGVVLGNLFLWTSAIGTQPGIVQRFLSVPTKKDTTIILVIFAIFTFLTKSISCFSGLIMYAKYKDCDPLTAGYIQKADQILPYYVLDIAGDIPGLSGLFLSGLLSTALSTLSTFINAFAGIVYADFVSYFMPKDTSEKRASTIMKILTVVIGLVCVVLVFIVEKLGSLLQMVLVIMGLTNGPIFGLFTIGMLVPFANKKGALSGLITSFLFMLVVVIQNQIYVANGSIIQETKPFSTLGCNDTSLSPPIFTLTNETTTYAPHYSCKADEPSWVFRISFYYYIVISTSITIVVGIIVSWITKSNTDTLVNIDLLSPCIHRFISNSASTTRYESVEKELNQLNSVQPSLDDNDDYKIALNA